MLSRTIKLFGSTLAILCAFSAEVFAQDKMQDHIKGEFATVFDFENPPKALPAAEFFDAEDKSLTIDAVKGKLTLVNFWATWCAPCKVEMPHMAAAQKKWADKGFQVVAISVDSNAKRAAQYLKDNELDNMRFLHDRKMQGFRALGGLGVPFTLLLNDEGNILGRMQGIADWSSQDADSLIDHFLKQGEPKSG